MSQTMVALAVGLVAGLGLWLAGTGWRPSPEPLGSALDRLDRRMAPTAAATAVGLDRDTRAGRFLLDRIPLLGRLVERMAADLRVVGTSAEEHAVRVGSYVAVALFTGAWVVLVGSIAGIGLPPVIPALVTVGGAVWGAVVPFARVRRTAAARRREFAHALSAWCDVVVMTLAAGRGVEQAMETGASAGDGWAFAELRGALTAGYVRGDPPWEALAQLGRELRVRDLEELSSTLSMAGEEGAAVRETLAIKSRTIRQRRTAEEEQQAASSTEKMGLPAVLVVAGFMVFLGYPMVTILLQGAP